MCINNLVHITKMATMPIMVENLQKSSSPEPVSFYILYVASIFGMQHCYVELYINPAKNAPRVRNGPTPGVNSSLRLTNWKNIKNDLLLQNHMAQNFHML